MTTAHRPTWAPAKGHEEEGSNRLYFKTTVRSAKNIAGFTKLKMRQAGQSTISEIQAKDLRAELEAKEKSHFEKNRNFEGELYKHKNLHTFFFTGHFRSHSVPLCSSTYVLCPPPQMSANATCCS